MTWSHRLRPLCCWCKRFSTFSLPSLNRRQKLYFLCLSADSLKPPWHLVLWEPLKGPFLYNARFSPRAENWRRSGPWRWRPAPLCAEMNTVGCRCHCCVPTRSVHVDAPTALATMWTMAPKLMCFSFTSYFVCASVCVVFIIQSLPIFIHVPLVYHRGLICSLHCCHVRFVVH